MIKDTVIFALTSSVDLANEIAQQLGIPLGNCDVRLFADGEIRREKALPVKTVEDTNGAGDAFMAGALAALDAGEKDWRKILRTANACGALAVGQKGAYPEWDKDSLAAVTEQ